MIVIVDYDTGNLCSIGSAITRLGKCFKISNNHSEIERAEYVILPGVGEASSAMSRLKDKELDVLIKKLRQPVLGICIGMQLLCSYSEEGDTECMGVFPNRVMRLKAQGEKIPHMGWNKIERLKTDLFVNIPEYSYQYFIHSFAPNINQYTIATTGYGVEFSSALNRDNFYGTQFHPEKSGEIGERILLNFLNINKQL